MWCYCQSCANLKAKSYSDIHLKFREMMCDVERIVLLAIPISMFFH